MKLRDFIIVFIVIWVAVLTGSLFHIFNIEKKLPTYYVKLEQSEFLNEELNDSTLLKALVYEDYYHFLLRIKYAEDIEYISKVKSIVSKLPP